MTQQIKEEYLATFYSFCVVENPHGARSISEGTDINTAVNFASAETISEVDKLHLLLIESIEPHFSQSQSILQTQAAVTANSVPTHS